MGTDCEIHIEIKIEGKWHHYRHIDQISRHYRVFGLMAGVRSGKAIVEPRGVPADMTIVSWCSYHDHGEDDHTHSWLSSEEVIHLGEFDNDMFGDLFGYPFWRFQEFRHLYPDFVEDFRFIFWFNC